MAIISHIREEFLDRIMTVMVCLEFYYDLNAGNCETVLTGLK